MPLVVPLEDAVATPYMNLARRLRDDGSVSPEAVLVFINVAADLTKPDANFLRLTRLAD